MVADGESSSSSYSSNSSSSSSSAKKGIGGEDARSRRKTGKVTRSGTSRDTMESAWIGIELSGGREVLRGARRVETKSRLVHGVSLIHGLARCPHWSESPRGFSRPRESVEQRASNKLVKYNLHRIASSANEFPSRRSRIVVANPSERARLSSDDFEQARAIKTFSTRILPHADDAAAARHVGTRYGGKSVDRSGSIRRRLRAVSRTNGGSSYRLWECFIESSARVCVVYNVCTYGTSRW